MPERIDVFISSTSQDLPVHRKEAMDACLRMGMFPIMMEHLPASDSDAIEASLDMVDHAEIYLGIFAWRYGYIPAGYDISITEMEYTRAVERGLPCYIFIMHDDHEIKGADIEKGVGAAKLEIFKQKVMTTQIVNFFKSPEDLRGHVIHSLVPHRLPEVGNLHSRYARDIPLPPDSYVAHPYSLLQTGQVIGRKKELAFLTDWATQVHGPIFNFVVAIGGMGKSALTWKWFQEIAPQVMPDLAGRMWWSFYESDASFENFIIRALAYISRQPKEIIEQLPISEQEMQLLSRLDQEPFLIVLDGLERLMLAYARMDAARMLDDDLDEQTANYAPSELPANVRESFLQKHHLRKSADPRIGAFLRKLAQLKNSRILVSSRLYPAELQTVTGEPIPGSQAYFLRGLEDDDALALWSAYQVSGSPEILLPVFHTFENYPLLIRALAGEVATFRRAPGDFDQWRQANPDFSPATLPIVQVKSHVLIYALKGLNPVSQDVLQTIAAFRMPVDYDVLVTLLVKKGKDLASEQELDHILTELEDRGLVGWDKQSNRYDLHPIVRSVVWDLLPQGAQLNKLDELYGYFESLPKLETIQSFDDLAPLIEAYYLLIALERYDEALNIYSDRLYRSLVHTYSVHPKRIEMLKALFKRDEPLPQLKSAKKQNQVLSDLANAYVSGGEVREALDLFERSINLSRQGGDQRILKSSLNYFSDALTLVGHLYKAEQVAIEALSLSQEEKDTFTETISLFWLGTVWEAKGKSEEAQTAFLRSISLSKGKKFQPAALSHTYLAQALVWRGDYTQALAMADRSWELCLARTNQRNFIKVARIQGMAYMGLGDLGQAEEKLNYALKEARIIGYLEEEIPAGVGVGELYRRQGNYLEAKEIVDKHLEMAQDRGYWLNYADGLNILTHIELDLNHPKQAIQMAQSAFKASWCDGPPHAYYWGLEIAKQYLDELGVPYPEMPPFDVDQHPELPKIEINPTR